MVDQLAPAPTTEQVFRVGNRPLVMIALGVLFFSLAPAMSIHEVVTTGTIDLEAVGKGRRAIPTWQFYAYGWLVGAPFLWYGVPMLVRYLANREMFRLGPHLVVIGGQNLAPEEVIGFRFSYLRGHVLRSTRGEFPIHPWMVRGGVEALAGALPHIPPLKKADWPRD